MIGAIGALLYSNNNFSGKHDLPLNFHPVAIRASAGDAPSSAVSVSA